MDSKKYYRQILPLVIFAIIVSLGWLYWTIGRTIVSLIGNNAIIGGDHESLRWSIVIGYSALAIILVLLQTVFLIKQMQAHHVDLVEQVQQNVHGYYIQMEN